MANLALGLKQDLIPSLPDSLGPNCYNRSD